jgi:hypothetical protein
MAGLHDEIRRHGVEEVLGIHSSIAGIGHVQEVDAEPLQLRVEGGNRLERLGVVQPCFEVSCPSGS